MESQSVEYKRQWREEFLKEICAFANSQGGTLYVGIDDNGNLYGLEKPKELLENLPNQCIMLMGILPAINLHEQDGKQYIEVIVKPSEQAISLKGSYYVRSGSTAQELKGTALNDFLLRKMNTTWDAMTIPTATIDDLDREAIDFFLNEAIRADRLPRQALNDSTEKILRNLSLIGEDGHLTIAALLLFGKQLQRWSMTAAFRIGRFGASNADLITQDSITTPLILMPDTVITTLRSKYLTSPISYDGLRRREPLEIPEDALREIICNAIVHKDYLGTYIQMRVYNDRIELYNQGELPAAIGSVENLLQPHESHPRNKLIAQIFYLAGFIETWGREYEKINYAFENEHLRPPVYEQKRGGMLVTIPREKFTQPMGEVAPVNAPVNALVNAPVNKTQRAILDLIIQNSKITYDDIAETIGVNRSTVMRYIRKMKGIYIERVGADKTGYWKILYVPNR